MDVTYRSTDDGWEPVLATGERLAPVPDLAAARAAVHERFGAGTNETVQVPLEGHGVVWDGIRFELLPPLYGANDPSTEQNARLVACAEYYRARVPAGMRVECAGNRVRIDPAPFGLAADLFSALDGTETTATADDARAQLLAAVAVAVPEGFVRVVHDFAGLEEVGEAGHVHLVLAERWPGDAPCL
ncbi:hypothetical protein [Cryptosporangium sp. NPDC048952]|uniref:hypothetical protein n=1 Tax=Cryptosporangium sp. NPDC048952 TaxID=3363961 RepID=UPI00371E1267